MLSEKQIQDKIIKQLKKMPETKVIKIIRATTTGEPDIVVCYKGRFIAIEVKNSKGQARGNQISKIKQIRKAKGIAFVLRDPKLLKQLLKTKKVGVFDEIDFSKFILNKVSV